MSWDFSTEPDFQKKLDWVAEFCRTEVEPLDLIFPYAVRSRDPKIKALVKPLQDQVKEQGLWALFLDKDLGLALGQSATPPEVESATRRLGDLNVQHRVLRREEAVGLDHSERLAEIEEAIAVVEKELAELTARWEKERDLVRQVREARTQLEVHFMGEPDEAAESEKAEPAEASAEAEAGDTDDAGEGEATKTLEKRWGEIRIQML